jgi:polyphosphate kinase 2 (PPK2 family)
VKNQYLDLLFDGVSNGSTNVKSAKTKRRRKPKELEPKLSNDVYRAELFRLQTEFVKAQEWVRYSGARIVVIFEGRDGAGKGGTISPPTGRWCCSTGRGTTAPVSRKSLTPKGDR